jgi:hypothetical protein
MEMAFLPFFEYSDESARTLSRLLAQQPDLFLQLLSQMYRREGETEPVDQATEERTRRITNAEHARRVLHVWKGYPGEGLPTDEREAKLEAWAAHVLDQALADGRGGVASVHIAEVLARAPNGSDGLWPCLAARRLLEKGSYQRLPDHLHSAKYNLRGVVGSSLTEGGVQEHEVAHQYRAAAEQVQSAYPHTAAMLDSLARTYESEADEQDAEARPRRIAYGEDAEDRAALPAVTGGEPPGPLTRIEIHNVGPARDMAIEPAARLTVLLGDNSAGKTFAIDILWWGLTGTWPNPELPARPRPANGKGTHGAKGAPSIVVVAGNRRGASNYDALHERWTKPFEPPPARGLTVYARVDGGFSIWDPVRNAKPAEPGELDLSAGYHFSHDDLWKGVRGPDRMTSICHGILEDAVLWRSEQRDAFALLEKALAGLSPPGESIQLGLPQRFAQREDRKLPTLVMPWGPVFAVHASAAVKRVLGLAYALVWGWINYREAAALAGVAPLPHVVMLIDEIEAHLHPKWQRTILPALLKIADAFEVEVQIVVSTHAPTVLASLEGTFDDEKDALFQFSLPEPPAEGRDAEVTRVLWPRHGDVNAWLSARDAFRTPTRGPAVQAILDEASRLFEEAEPDPKHGRAIDRKLRKVLGELDPFWVRWRFIAEKRGWIRDPGRKKARPAGV